MHIARSSPASSRNWRRPSACSYATVSAWDQERPLQPGCRINRPALSGALRERTRTRAAKNQLAARARRLASPIKSLLWRPAKVSRIPLPSPKLCRRGDCPAQVGPPHRRARPEARCDAVGGNRATCVAVDTTWIIMPATGARAAPRNRRAGPAVHRLLAQKYCGSPLTPVLPARRGSSHAPDPIELRSAVANVFEIGTEGGRLVIHAKRRIGWVLPKSFLHLAADLLLRRQVHGSRTRRCGALLSLGRSASRITNRGRSRG